MTPLKPTGSGALIVAPSELNFVFVVLQSIKGNQCDDGIHTKKFLHQVGGRQRTRPLAVDRRAERISLVDPNANDRFRALRRGFSSKLVQYKLESCMRSFGVFIKRRVMALPRAPVTTVSTGGRLPGGIVRSRDSTQSSMISTHKITIGLRTDSAAMACPRALGGIPGPGTRVQQETDGGQSARDVFASSPMSPAAGRRINILWRTPERFFAEEARRCALVPQCFLSL